MCKMYTNDPIPRTRLTTTTMTKKRNCVRNSRHNNVCYRYNNNNTNMAYTLTYSCCSGVHYSGVKRRSPILTIW